MIVYVNNICHSGRVWGSEDGINKSWNIPKYSGRVWGSEDGINKPWNIPNMICIMLLMFIYICISNTTYSQTQ